MRRFGRARFGLLLAIAPAHGVAGQGVESAQLGSAKRLIVHVLAPPLEAHGSGIVIGRSDSTVYIATARHVLSLLGSPAEVRVSFFDDSAKLVRAVVSPRTYSGDPTQYDIGLLLVSVSEIRRVAKLVDLESLELDRLADRARLTAGDRVYSVGCPHGVCWELPADESIFTVGDHMTFVTQFVSPGNSGGGLVSRWGEIAGMVVQSKPPVGLAVDMDVVLDSLEEWGAKNAKVLLRRPTVPRWPYRIEFRGLWLYGSRETLGSARSGLAGVDVEIVSNLSWHLEALRLAADNLRLTGAVVGLSAPFHAGRLTVAPFGDVGIARTDAQYDIGGYYSSTGNTNTYQPTWSPLSGFGFGGGGGFVASVIILPRTSLELLGVHWAFQLPVNAPSLSDWYAGLGLRWALK